jgi:membrane dipeptidase
MLIFDGDYPMAYGALDLKRDLTRPIADVRAAEAGSDIVATASLPELRHGHIAAALVKVVGRIERPGSPIWGYRTGDIAYAMAQAHLVVHQL